MMQIVVTGQALYHDTLGTSSGYSCEMGSTSYSLSQVSRGERYVRPRSAGNFQELFSCASVRECNSS